MKFGIDFLSVSVNMRHTTQRGNLDPPRGTVVNLFSTSKPDSVRDSAAVSLPVSAKVFSAESREEPPTMGQCK